VAAGEVEKRVAMVEEAMAMGASVVGKVEEMALGAWVEAKAVAALGSAGGCWDAETMAVAEGVARGEGVQNRNWTTEFDICLPPQAPDPW